MVVHACVECESVALNRIAADDDAHTVFVVFQSSLNANQYEFFIQHGIDVLDADDIEIVYTQLYGQSIKV